MIDPTHRLRIALADCYLLERELGRGGMATVYLARDLKHERPMALKVLHPELAATSHPEFTESGLPWREISGLDRLRAPGLTCMVGGSPTRAHTRKTRQGRPPSLSGIQLRRHDRIFSRRLSRVAACSRCAPESAPGDSHFRSSVALVCPPDLEAVCRNELGSPL